MKRGWILIFSVLFEVAAIVGLFFLFPVTIIGGIGALPLVFLVLPFVLIYFWWAPNNLFFTFIPEGRAKIVVRGDAFQEVLLQWEGSIITTPGMSRAADQDVWDVIEGSARRRILGGLRFYGIWPIVDIYVYDFSWINIRQNGEIQRHDKEALDYILVKDDTYFTIISQAEDQQLLPLDIGLVLTIRVLNPYKALFRVQSWLETVINRIEPAVRDALTQDTYENWIGEDKDLADRILSDTETQELLGEFKRRYGIDVRAIEVRDINPGEDYRKATLQGFLGKREAERINEVYARIQSFGDVGKLVRTLEALEKSPGEGAKWVLAVPGLGGLLNQVFPGREASSLSPEELRGLRELLEQIRREKGEEGASGDGD